MDTARSRISQTVSHGTLNGAKARILVLEDDHVMGKAIESTLRESGYIVDWVEIPDQALNRLRTEAFDLILLDWQLPGLTGGEFLSLIRKFSNIPVVIESGNSGLDFRLKAFELGADDILTKPYGLKELCARVKAILRRTKEYYHPDLIQVGDVHLNLSQNTITRNGKSIPIGSKEMEFVRLLLEIPGKPVSKEVITQFLFPHRKNNNPSRCDVYIYRIRQKLGQEFVRCRHGEGYYIEPSPPTTKTL